MAVIHLAAVNVQGDRRLGWPAIAQRVIFEGRNQASRRSLVGFHAGLGLESEDTILFVDEIVLANLHVAVDHAFDTPDPGVVVQRRSLARSPRHHHRGITPGRVGVEQASCVAVGARLLEHVGQSEPVAFQRVYEYSFHPLRDRRRTIGTNRYVQLLTKRVEAGRSRAGAHTAASSCRQADIPPATFMTRSTPARSRTLAASAERYPPSHIVATGRLRGISAARDSRSPSGTWSAPSMCPLFHSRSVRTSTTSGASAPPMVPRSSCALMIPNLDVGREAASQP